MKNTLFPIQSTQFKNSANGKHILRFILTACFLFGAIPKAKSTETSWADNLIGHGFTFASIGKETSMPVILSYSVTNIRDAGTGSLRQAMLDAIAAGAGPYDINFDTSLRGRYCRINSFKLSIFYFLKFLCS